jgi:hypothetical protein
MFTPLYMYLCVRVYIVGEYWGESGYARIERGVNMLAIESSCAWATPASFTTTNTPCYEGGSNCITTQLVQDPATLGDEVKTYLKNRFL